ncbi:MAG: sigma 54-interacting transcriptional regulator [Desulfobaccales bacterium]
MLLSLKSKLLASISAIVILTGLAIAGIVTQRYSGALRQEMMGQSEYLAHAIALDAADRIFINDLVGLQKMLDQQRRTHPGLAYLFILKDGHVIAHTFEKGMPASLLEVNQPISQVQPGFRQVVSETGNRYLDTALPIFEGKAGILRLGFSESHYRGQLVKLWVEIGIITLGLLVLALLGGLLFVRRITRPLAALVAATREIDRGEPHIRVEVNGNDEIATLSTSFNHMVSRQEEYTRRLEEQTLELERAYEQARTACQIVQEMGALYTLKEMGAFLLKKLQDVLRCPHIALLLLNGVQDTLFVLSAGEVVTICRDPQVVQAAQDALEGSTATIFPRELAQKLPVIARDFFIAEHRTIIPFTDNHIRGAAVIACPDGFHGSSEQIQWVGLVLKQNAGALGRAILYEEEMGSLKGRVEAQAGFGEIIGKDPKMQVVYKLIEDVASSDATVLIQGESGTGKELVARAIHRLSLRQAKPFVVINCAAYPATLLESELFGHEKGAFTGATRQKPGRFEQASGGTVFLDEIGEIPAPAQIKLLRVLQTRKFERVGGEKTLTVDVRVLAATNKDLLQEVKKGNFREDLFYRLNVIPIVLPPLRARRNDIPMLSLHFLQRFAGQQGKALPGFSSEAMRLILEYPWPGNVRELENSIEHAVVLTKGSQVEVWDLPSGLREGMGTPPTIMERELQHVMQVLEECGWNKKQAARRLGISRNTLYAILRRHNIGTSRPVTH